MTPSHAARSPYALLTPIVIGVVVAGAAIVFLAVLVIPSRGQIDVDAQRPDATAIFAPGDAERLETNPDRHLINRIDEPLLIAPTDTPEPEVALAPDREPTATATIVFDLTSTPRVIRTPTHVVTPTEVWSFPTSIPPTRVPPVQPPVPTATQPPVILPTSTPIPEPSSTPRPRPTATAVPPTSTPVPTQPVIEPPSPTPTLPIPTATLTATPLPPTATVTPAIAPVDTATPTPTATATVTSSPTATPEAGEDRATATPDGTGTPTPTGTPKSKGNRTPTPTGEVSPDDPATPAK